MLIPNKSRRRIEMNVRIGKFYIAWKLFIFNQLGFTVEKNIIKMHTCVG